MKTNAAQMPPVIASISRKLNNTHLSLDEFTALLVILEHETLITNTFLSNCTKHPGTQSLKRLREIQSAFESLHSLLSRVDAGEAPHE